MGLSGLSLSHCSRNWENNHFISLAIKFFRGISEYDVAKSDPKVGVYKSLSHQPDFHPLPVPTVQCTHPPVGCTALIYLLSKSQIYSHPENPSQELMYHLKGHFHEVGKNLLTGHY